MSGNYYDEDGSYENDEYVGSNKSMTTSGKIANVAMNEYI